VKGEQKKVNSEHLTVISGKRIWAL